MTSERDKVRITDDQMRKFIQKCRLSVFPEKFESVLISWRAVPSERDTALIAADPRCEIIQKCWSLVFPHKSESLLTSLSLCTVSERDNCLAAADKMPQQSWSLMFPENLFD